ncbi:MAG: sulfotransferase domain-containing protein [Candidatus Woesearchaeota archaeon]
MFNKIFIGIKNYSLIPGYVHRKILETLRSLTGLGSLPDYIIIGAQKCGTTSLQEYMEQHPKILSPSKKEVHFFDLNYYKGLSWYKKHFPILKKYRKKIVGEASPYYIHFPPVAQRISKCLPDIKLIVLLRDPVKRAFSQYNSNYNKGREKRSFEESIEDELKNLPREYKKVDKGKYSNKHQNEFFLDRGKYYIQLKNWFMYLKREQFIIIKSEDFFGNPQREVSKIFHFIGVEDYLLHKTKIHNKTKKDMVLNEDTKKRLCEFFLPYNKKLYKLLGRDFGWDKCD